MKLVLLLFSTLVFMALTSCKQPLSQEECVNAIQFPKTSFKYPEHPIAADSSFIYAAFKDSLSERDSFYFAYSGYHYMKSFDEKNLSIQPTDEIIIRISYDAFSDTPFLLKMTCNEIILKVGDSGEVYPYEDLNKLSPIEYQHFRFLNKHFPVHNSVEDSGNKARYLDSMTTRYPELLSASYYWNLREIAARTDSFPFSYSIYRKPITPVQFRTFINNINAAGFWNFPAQMDREESITDGGGFFVEIHTPEQYRMVISGNCPLFQRKLTLACQEMIDFVKPANQDLRLCN